MVAEPDPAASPAADRPAIFLLGPTAAGKTELALALCQRYPCEVVSVDSAMVYRGMDIGTAKPDRATLASVPHHLIDIREPTEAYSAAEFRRDALALMHDITQRGRIPLLVGGTFLYFRALEQGLAPLPSADPVVRARLQAELAREGLPALHARLQALDPVAGQRIHPNDPQRILRALEVQALTGRPLSELQAAAAAEPLPYRLCKLAVAPPQRAELHDRIARRFEQMLAAGFEQEVRELVARHALEPTMPAMRAVGYRQMLRYLAGECDHATMVTQAVQATRQLAKRQLTWLRSETGVHGVPGGEGVTAAAMLQAASAWLEERLGSR